VYPFFRLELLKKKKIKKPRRDGGRASFAATAH
jgi:hypothetical protein